MSPLSKEVPPVPEHVAETVETLAELHQRAERDVPRHQRSIDALTDLLGRSTSVFLIVGGVIGWVMLNTFLPRLGATPLDPPPFAFLQAASSVGAFMAAAMVLSTQDRQRKRAEKFERLDLQVNLLAERKLAKLISLVEELRRDMPNVVNRLDPLAEAMTKAVDPHAVADAIKQTLEHPAAEPDAPTDRSSRG
jgi:uncharacterized membrane protein